MADHGIEHVPGVPLEPSAFEGAARAADVLHVHWLYPLLRGPHRPWRGPDPMIRDGLARLGSIRALGVPLVWTVHNLEPHDGFRRGEREAYQAVHDMADLRVFHSESARGGAEAAYPACGGASIVTYHPALGPGLEGDFPVPRPRADVLADEGIPPGHRLLLCFGQIRRHKGFDVAMRAMRRLAGDAVTLVVAGRPVDRSIHRLRWLGAGRPSIRLVPEVLPPARLSDLLGAADVVLLPYRTITGSGALMHALGAGRAVVTSDLPYFREILGMEPDAGVLVPPNDPRALAQGIRELLARDPRARVAAARALAGRFSWDAAAAPVARWIRARVAGAPPR
jgi:glycosyltransferase involved in cell wall biosynthesis